MDTLQFEIELVQNSLIRVERLRIREQLEVEGLLLVGDEVTEVLNVIQMLRQTKLAQLMSLQTQGATS